MMIREGVDETPPDDTPAPKAQAPADVPPVAEWTQEDDDRDIEDILRLLAMRDAGK